jgi:hypothetical protein
VTLTGSRTRYSAVWRFGSMVNSAERAIQSACFPQSSTAIPRLLQSTTSNCFARKSALRLEARLLCATLEKRALMEIFAVISLTKAKAFLFTIGLGLSLLATSCTLETFEPCEGDACEEIRQRELPVIYGVDHRREATDPVATTIEKQTVQSTALVVSKDPTFPGSPMTCTASTCLIGRDILYGEDLLGNSALGLCPGERFGPSTTLPDGQHTASAGYGSSFLVAPDIVATAAHVVDPAAPQTWDDCASVAFVFDYTATTGGDGPVSVPVSNVYHCASIIRHDRANDIAIIRLDRAVTGRTPLPIRRIGKLANNAPLLLAGHPDSFPMKIAAGASPKVNTDANFFETNADAFHGNSGGPILNHITGLVEGLVSRGQEDYTVDTVNGCLRTNICPDTGCPGYEKMARAKSFQADVPDQSPRAFSSGTLSISTNYASVASGDFDGDGRSDVLFQGPTGGSDVIWYGKYDKTDDPVTVTVPDSYGVPIVGDFDNDKHSDIFWYRSGTGQDRIWWGQPTRSNFGAAANITSMREDGVGYVPFAGDFDGNGGTDLFWYGRGAAAPAEKIWWSNRNRNGQPTNGTTPTFTPQDQSIGGTEYYPVAGDFNFDGKADIFWFKPGSPSGSMWRHTTGTSFASTTQTIPTTITASHRPFVGDYDGNGAVDILFYGPAAVIDYVWWFRIDSVGLYRSTSVTAAGSYLPAAGDFNGDTATDVLWYGPSANSDARSWGRLR